MLWNRAAAALFGYSETEALGRPLTLLLREQDRVAHLEGIRRFLASGEQGQWIGKMTETFGLRKDGTTFRKEMSLATGKADGEWVFISVMRDIGGRKRAEEALEKRVDEIERMNRLMVGRELKMEELRREIVALKREIADLRHGAGHE